MLQHNTNKSIEAIDSVRRAASSKRRITGFTHRFYRYPARFSPEFARACIEAFSIPGDIVLDPYMGGGTTIVEAVTSGRAAIGCDLNSLAVFVARAKTSVLEKTDSDEIQRWANSVVHTLLYNANSQNLEGVVCEARTKNLAIPRARTIKKVVALALNSLESMDSELAKSFIRCALLNVSQWALNGRKDPVTLVEFRTRLFDVVFEMLRAVDSYATRLRIISSTATPVLIHDSSENIGNHAFFRNGGRANLVVTSPPYPGVHVLYHRWQVDGRKETPAPYWIANCLDGQGSSFYNFGDRHQEGHEDYFHASLKTLTAIRSAMKERGVMVQMVAFSEPRSQLKRYLENMERAGFRELKSDGKLLRRIWRAVPGRSWHAEQKGHTNSAREVALIHEAI